MWRNSSTNPNMHCFYSETTIRRYAGSSIARQIFELPVQTLSNPQGERCSICNQYFVYNAQEHKFRFPDFGKMAREYEFRQDLVRSSMYSSEQLQTIRGLTFNEHELEVNTRCYNDARPPTCCCFTESDGYAAYELQMLYGFDIEGDFSEYAHAIDPVGTERTFRPTIVDNEFINSVLKMTDTKKINYRSEDSRKRRNFLRRQRKKGLTVLSTEIDGTKFSIAVRGIPPEILNNVEVRAMKAPTRRKVRKSYRKRSDVAMKIIDIFGPERVDPVLFNGCIDFLLKNKVLESAEADKIMNRVMALNT